MTLRRLLLLRHGQTEYNLDGRMQGHLDTKLTDQGQAQAAEAAPLLAETSIDRIVSSDLARAHETALAVSATTGMPVVVDPRLRETDLGDWQGSTVAEIESATPGAIAAWRADPRWSPPGGESRVQVVARSMPVVDELEAEFAGDDTARSALLVAHGGLIAGLVSSLLGLPEVSWPVIGGMGNAKWAVVARRSDHPRWRLSAYNTNSMF